MKLKYFLLTLFAGLAFGCNAYAQKAPSNSPKGEDIVSRQYLFGVATSYADSVTMVTMVAAVDSMAMDPNSKAPLGLDLYTDSFRNFLLARGLEGYVCSTFVCPTEKEAEKRLAHICKRVNKNPAMKLRSVDGFKYHFIATDKISNLVGEDNIEH